MAESPPAQAASTSRSMAAPVLQATVARLDSYVSFHQLRTSQGVTHYQPI
jgi:hypothetical protein